MDTTDRPDTSPSTGESAEEVALGRSDFPARWGLIAIGGASILAGLVALALPLVVSLTAVMILGGCLIFSGAVGLVAAARLRRSAEMAGSLALSLLALAGGLLMLLQPYLGIFALATLIIAWLGASGALRLWYALRRDRGGLWLGLSGLAALILALLLWFGLPFNAAWLPGVVLGLDLIVWGALLIGLSRRVKSANVAEEATEQTSTDRVET